MSAHPHERLSTADMVSAGQAPSRPESPEGVKDTRPESPEDVKDTPASNVRRIDRPVPSDATTVHGARDERPGALLAATEATELRHQWETIQIAFVDEPRRAVEDADSLVAQAMKRVAEVFAEERARLERQWSEGQDVSTEDLRVALTRYRSFFDRLLSV
jgi:hypothetical protein